MWSVRNIPNRKDLTMKQNTKTMSLNYKKNVDWLALITHNKNIRMSILGTFLAFNLG